MSRARSQPSAVDASGGALGVVVAVAWVGAVLLFVGLRVPYLDLPLSRDEGEYAYVAQNLVEPDFVPYRDAFIHKPPGAFLVYFAAIHGIDESARGIRTFALLWMAATMLAVGWLGRRLAGDLAGALAAFVFAAANMAPSLLGPTANTEMLLLLPMTLSVGAALRARETGGTLAWGVAGALAAAAIGFKLLAAPYGLFLAALALASEPGGSSVLPTRLRRVAAVAAVAAGALATALPVILYFAAQGSLGEFLDAVLLYNAGYAFVVPVAVGLGHLVRELSSQLPELGGIWVLAAAGLLPAAAAARGARGLLAGWLAACAVGIALGLYFRPHYFVIALPPLCILAGIGGARAIAWTAQRGPGRAAVVASAVAILVLAPTLGTHAAHVGRGDLGATSRMLWGLNPFFESPEIAEAIRRETGPGDRVLIVGSEPQILFLAGRRSATRYILTYPLMTPGPRALERQREALAEVAGTKPAAVLLVRIPSSHLRQPGAADLLLREATRMARSSYRLDALWVATPEGLRRVEEGRAQAVECSLRGPRPRASVALFLAPRDAAASAEAPSPCE